MTYENFEHSHQLRMDMYKLTHMPSRTNNILSMDLCCTTFALVGSMFVDVLLLMVMRAPELLW